MFLGLLRWARTIAWTAKTWPSAGGRPCFSTSSATSGSSRRCGLTSRTSSRWWSTSSGSSFADRKRSWWSSRSKTKIAKKTKKNDILNKHWLLSNVNTKQNSLHLCNIIVKERKMNIRSRFWKRQKKDQKSIFSICFSCDSSSSLCVRSKEGNLVCLFSIKIKAKAKKAAETALQMSPKRIGINDSFLKLIKTKYFSTYFPSPQWSTK